jgi:hypothetical protein
MWALPDARVRWMWRGLKTLITFLFLNRLARRWLRLAPALAAAE